MIFVTVGHQMPFDRMIRLVDQWAASHPEHEVVAQIGNADYRPRHLSWMTFLTPDEFRKNMGRARVVVAHAGMGSILAALENSKPILVFPRLAQFRETRNDHQVDTAIRLMKLGRVTAAFTEEEFSVALDGLDCLVPAETISPYASLELIETIRAFIGGEEMRHG